MRSGHAFVIDGRIEPRVPQRRAVEAQDARRLLKAAPGRTAQRIWVDLSGSVRRELSRPAMLAEL
jgi:hypothetical protein